jgi:cell division septation protein DedD
MKVQTPTPVPVEKPKPSIPTGTGPFTVQVSSWQSRSKADEEVNRLRGASLDAFVEEGTVAGERWYRVRIGRYGSRQDAGQAATRFGQILENGAWVARVGS